MPQKPPRRMTDAQVGLRALRNDPTAGEAALGQHGDG